MAAELKRHEIQMAIANLRSQLAETGEVGFTVCDLVECYLAHCDEHYADGIQYREFVACKLMLDLHGAELAENFGPRKLKALRKQLVDAGRARTYIRDLVAAIKRMVRWAASEELMPSRTWHDLRTVSGLRRGQAHEPEPRQPVPDEVVAATLRFLTPVVAAMVQLQRTTGARPSELFGLRPCDIDRTDDVWLYRPHRHKTWSKGKARVLALGPRGQEVLAPFLDRPADVYCFSPKESAAHHINNVRKTTGEEPFPVVPGQMPTRVLRAVRDRYTKDVYARAVARAARRAGVEHWTPYQLRHSVGTDVRDKYGLEAAQVYLGHAHADVTQIYAKTNLEDAKRIAREIG